jgi:uncharacterized protein (TIGR02284 family)
MSIETTVDKLNDLIEVSKDGERGFRASAERVSDPETRQSLLRHAAECADAATELRALALPLGGPVANGGSAAGALHRGWIALKGALAGYSDLQILEEVERGEDVALQRYAQALQADLLVEVRAVIQRQFAGLQRNHAQIRTLRELARR